jgi:hypothetical protein
MVNHMQDEHHYALTWYSEKPLHEYLDVEPFCELFLIEKIYKSSDEVKASMMEDKSVVLIAIPCWWEDDGR